MGLHVTELLVIVTQLSSLMVTVSLILNHLCTMPRGIETGVDVSTPTTLITASDTLVGVAVEPDICKHSFGYTPSSRIRWR